MNKDIEWLKERVSSRKKSAELNVMAHREGLSEDFESRVIAYESVLKLINQLDEPEVLSKKWIDNHTAKADTISYYSEDNVPVVTVSDLKGLLVPKQELPVIPKFVAEYIDNRKEVGFPIYQAIRIVRENSRFEHSHLREWLWTNKGQETFIRAWLDGYEVEKEKLYTIEFPQAEGVFARYTGDEFREWEIMDELVIIGNSDWQYKFTEAEIKAIDERYWAFTEEVTE